MFFSRSIPYHPPQAKAFFFFPYASDIFRCGHFSFFICKQSFFLFQRPKDGVDALRMAIAINPSGAVYYTNLAAAHWSKVEWFVDFFPNIHWMQYSFIPTPPPFFFCPPK